MPIFSFQGKAPSIADDAFIAPTASIVGDVVVESGASVWYGAVVRADYSRVVIKAGANVQDGAVIHGPPEVETVVGSGVTVAHLCVIHGAYLEDGCLVANGATVLDGARIGAGSLVAANSLVASGAQIPPGVLVAGSPAVVKRELAGAAAELVRVNGPAYAELARQHAAGIEAWPSTGS